MEWVLRSVGACGDSDGGVIETVGELVASLAGGWGLMGGGEETALCNEGDFLGGAHLFFERDDGGFEVA